jgi:hypothetical protein
MKMMNSKKQLTCATLALLVALWPTTSIAQNRLIAPLAGVGQVVVVEPLVNDVKVATDCRIDIKEVQKNIADYMQREGMPVITVENSADMVRTDMFRLTVRPEIATLKDGVVSCVSWVGLKAESQHTLRLPPLPDRKTVTVSYWSRGGLVMTPIVDHAIGVQNAYTILMRNFVKQYRIDNPGLTSPLAVENADTLTNKIPPAVEPAR